MPSAIPQTGQPARVTTDFTGPLRRRLQIGCFTLESLNALATAYYLNYLFFYMRKHYGFGNQDNLLLTVGHGFIYMFIPWGAGYFAQKRGYFFLLRTGFFGMALALALGGLAPRLLGYSHGAMLAEFGTLALWTVSMCLTWPSIQGLLSRNVAPNRMPAMAGIYNILWSAWAAVAMLTGGALQERFGGEILFWIPVGIHLVQLGLLPWLKKLSDGVIAKPIIRSPETASVAESHPHPGPKGKLFLHLAWLANPLAYIAMYGIVPVIPKLAERLGLTESYAGLVCSVWLWVRLGAFVWFWLWPGWHYRFGWLLTAFVALIASFTVALLSTHVWLLIVAEVFLGLSVGLIYYSSLFYTMDMGESGGKRGGIHEAAIGAGVFVGPAVGFAALHFLPGHADAGTWAISSVLLMGLAALLRMRYRKPRKA
ncbi:MAG: Major facilitator superfamily 1 [Pedosphaera sp.]|nr:Major facilitator superfamily 1 [Pedosphaera sp.]